LLISVCEKDAAIFPVSTLKQVRPVTGPNSDVAPGAIRAEESSEEGGTAFLANDHAPIGSPEIAETQKSLRQQGEHLDRAKNEADLLQRRLDLDKRMVCSNPEYTLRQSGKARLTVARNQIAEKQDEIQQTQQKIADLQAF